MLKTSQHYLIRMVYTYHVAEFAMNMLEKYRQVMSQSLWSFQAYDWTVRSMLGQLEYGINQPKKEIYLYKWSPAFSW